MPSLIMALKQRIPGKILQNRLDPSTKDLAVAAKDLKESLSRTGWTQSQWTWPWQHGILIEKAGPRTTMDLALAVRQGGYESLFYEDKKF